MATAEEELKVWESLEYKVKKLFKSYCRWTRFWSLAHHGFLFSAAIFSAGAGLLLKIDNPSWDAATIENIAALLAFIAAVMSTVGGLGGFQRKWKTNRRTKAALEILLIDIESKKIDTNGMNEQLKSIISNHHTGILGDA